MLPSERRRRVSGVTIFMCQVLTFAQWVLIIKTMFRFELSFIMDLISNLHPFQNFTLFIDPMSILCSVGIINVSTAPN